MHEKDVELTRLLLDKQRALEIETNDLRARLMEARANRDNALTEAKERGEVQEVLAEAASLLERPDLNVEPPDVTAIEHELDGLSADLNALTEDFSRVEGLILELRRRAPALIAAAEAMTPSTHDADVSEYAYDYESSPQYSKAGEESAEVMSEHASALEIAEGLDELPLDKPSTAEYLSIFNLDSMANSEAFYHGSTAIFIIDSDSVIAATSAELFGGPSAGSNEVCNRMAKGFAALATEIDGSFHLVFNGHFSPDYYYTARVAVDFVDSGEPVPKEELYGRMVYLVEKYKGMLKTVFIVTEDDALRDLVSSKGANCLPVSALFS